MYINALKRSGFKKVSFAYQEKEDTANKVARKRNRKRDVVWYTPPYSKNVQTKIGGTFFYLLQKFFPKESKLHKVINKSTVKLSYSSMPSLKRIISTINSSKLNKEQNNVNGSKKALKSCNGLVLCKNGCIVDGRCKEKDVIYKATCTDQDLNEKIYIGETAETFKKRCGGHYTTFNKIAYKNDTSLAKHI